MNIPIGLVVASRPARNFDKGAKVIYQKEIITIEDNVKQFYTLVKRVKIPIPGLTQLFFEINTVDPGVLVTYGRSKMATVKVIFVDEERKWATIEYFSGKQKTVLVDQCRVKEPYLLPLRFDYYEAIQDEFQKLREDRINFVPDYMASMNYKAVEIKGVWVAVKHDPFERTYYTPELEEFHVNFEYEFKDSFGKWEPEVKDLDYWDSIPEDIERGLIRVKHLNKEDIEDLGFIKSEKTEGAFAMEQTYGETILIMNGDLVSIIDTSKKLNGRRRVFRGTIKNKSVLKQILTITGIPFNGRT